MKEVLKQITGTSCKDQAAVDKAIKELSLVRDIINLRIDDPKDYCVVAHLEGAEGEVESGVMVLGGTEAQEMFQQMVEISKRNAGQDE